MKSVIFKLIILSVAYAGCTILRAVYAEFGSQSGQ
jgi:hypothetical protein